MDKVKFGIKDFITGSSILVAMIAIFGYFVSFGEWKAKVNENVDDTDKNSRKIEELTKIQIQLVTMIDFQQEQLKIMREELQDKKDK